MRKSILGLVAACAMAVMLVGVVACGGGGQQGSVGSSAQPPAEAQSLFTEDGFPNPLSMSKALAEDASSLFKQLDAEYPSYMAGSAHDYYANENVRIAARNALYSSSLKEGEWVLELDDAYSDHVKADEVVKISGDVDTVAGILSRTLGVNLSSSDFKKDEDQYKAHLVDGQTVMYIEIPFGSEKKGLVRVSVYRNFD